MFKFSFKRNQYPHPKVVSPPEVPPPAPPLGNESTLNVHLTINGIYLEPIGAHESDPFEKENNIEQN
jgi:hypothetical protein